MKAKIFQNSKIIILLFMIGVGLRISLLFFNSPYYQSPDHVQYSFRALWMLGSGDLNPHYFKNPPLLTYLHAGFLVGQYLVGKLWGIFQQTVDFRDYFYADHATDLLVLINTLLAAVCGLLVYWQAKIFTSKRIALFSFALFHLCLVTEIYSVFAVNDMLATTLIIAAIYFSTLFLVKENQYYLFIAAFLSGLAVASKYNAGLVGISLLIAVLLSKHTVAKKTKLLFFVFILATTAFLAACPWPLLDTHSFWNDFTAQFNYSNSAWYGMEASSSSLQILKTLVWGFGLLPTLFALAALFFIRKEWSVHAVSLAFLLCYLFFFCKIDLFFVRFTLPLIPLLSIYAGVALYRLPRKHRGIIAFFVLLQPVLFLIQYKRVLGQEDTRELLATWIQKNMSSNDFILFERTATDPQIIVQGTPLVKNLAKGSSLIREPQEILKKLCQTKEVNPKYFVLSGTRQKAAIISSNSKALEAYEQLDSQAESLMKFSPTDEYGQIDNTEALFWNLFSVEKPGPHVELFRFNSQGSACDVTAEKT